MSLDQSPDRLTPVVLLHAFPLSSRMWDELAVNLRSEGFRTIAPDFPGFGENTEPVESLSDAAVMIIDGLKKAGIGKAVFCGVSMGGYLLLEILSRQPEIVGSAILCDTTSEADSPEKRISRETAVQNIESGNLDEFLETFPGPLLSKKTWESRPLVVQKLRDLYKECSADGAVGALKAMANRENHSGLLSTIRVPVLLVYGDEDPSLADGKMMHKKIKHSKLEIINGAGHYACLESPERFSDILLNFLNTKMD